MRCSARDERALGRAVYQPGEEGRRSAHSRKLMDKLRDKLRDTLLIVYSLDEKRRIIYIERAKTHYGD